MENVASLAVLLAFCAAIYALLASVVGRIRHKPFLIVSGERAVYSVWALLSVASGILVFALLTGDFRFSYVAQHSNRSMPLLYKFAAWWGGQEGSLLFWSWLLSTYSAVVVFTNRRKHRDMMPYVVGVLMFVQTFFLILNNFVVSPFKMLAVEGAITAVPDGNGLNPLLQYPAMAIHPPMLYLGYVGFTVPFAFAIASLITRQPAKLDPHHPPLDPGHLALPKHRRHARAWPGPITCSDGAATGVGTRSRTPRCSPGSAAPLSCTPS
jgi:cytochrome c-type biogenesis protein CcmF